MKKDKNVILLSKCVTNCNKCNSVVLRVRGFLNDNFSSFTPEIQGDINFNSDSIGHKRFKKLKEGKDYTITITPVK